MKIILNFFSYWRLKNAVKKALHEAKHARNMREDISDKALINKLNEAIIQLKEAFKNKHKKQDKEFIYNKINDLSAITSKIYPLDKYYSLKENFEVLTIAFVLAIALQTFFIQPFNIPTGSMQPTLYGVTMRESSENKIFDKTPLRFIKYFITGRYSVEMRAFAEGKINQILIEQFNPGDFQGALILGCKKDGSLVRKEIDAIYNAYLYTIGSYTIGSNKVIIAIPKEFKKYFQNGDIVRQNQLLATGDIQTGDHVLVNKVVYNFIKPKRGDIVVFKTAGITYEGIKKDMFYIKRLAGLPDEKISIIPPYLIADGKKITSPECFYRLLHDNNYMGYKLAYSFSNLRPKPVLNSETNVVILADNEFLPLGDNTEHSLDGRYFGPVKFDYVIGRAFAVYWPFTKRFGRVY